MLLLEEVVVARHREINISPRRDGEAFWLDAFLEYGRWEAERGVMCLWFL
jgi:hypothetical protein